jgi:hypothetical protein
MSHEPLPRVSPTGPSGTRPTDVRRTLRVALAPVLASIIAAAVFLVVSRAIEASTPGPDGDSIDLSQVVYVLVGAGGAAALAWGIGLAVTVAVLRPEGRRARLWWLLLGAGTATLLLGTRLVPTVLAAGPLVQAWVLQQVVLALVSVTADRRAARSEPQPPLTS